MAIPLWQQVTAVVGSAATGAGIFWGYQNSKTSKKSLDNTENRQARADERQAIADERVAFAAQRAASTEELEKLLGGYKQVFEEMRTEFDRMRDKYADCEAQHAETKKTLARLEANYLELQRKLVVIRASDETKEPPDAGTS